MVSLPYKTENSPKKERAPFYKLGNTMRYRAHSPDYTLFIITGILVLVGIFMIASASPVIGEVRFGEVYFFLKNQLIGVGVGAAIYLAAWLEAKQKEVSRFSTGFLPFLVMLGIVSLFFILQPDIGTLGVLAITATLLFFAGGGKLAQIGILCLIGMVGLFMIVLLQPYQRDRITTFLEPATDIQGIGYQLNQSLIAIGSGGFWGKGFGMSQQKFYYLPEPSGDSIFAVFGEEFGFIGSAILIILFLAFSWRGIRIANRAPDLFGSYLAVGITLLIVIQAFINMAAISGLIPLTGLPLSFISYGSSALVANLAAVGILMNISKYTRV